MKEISNEKNVEGMLILPTIGGKLDTITFKNEINCW